VEEEEEEEEEGGLNDPGAAARLQIMSMSKETNA